MTEVTSEPGLHCYIRHVRAAGVCARGSRDWCAANGIDWSAFLVNGIEADALLNTGDPIVARVVAAAVKERDNGR